jgi:myo-inositol-1(or 4)-monophosphatase
VTEADRAAERAIRDLVAARHPDHGVIGEEYGSHRPGADWVWVIDPIDGTRAFLTGRPMWGTLIALLRQGRPVLGLIDQPALGERWTGLVGQPTRFEGPLGGTAGCRPCPSLGSAELACTSPDMFDATTAPRFAALRAQVRRTSWGGDCYIYGLLALGLLDLVVDAGMQPWDWAALVPVVEGAGGRVTDWAGRPLALDSDGSVLAAGDAKLLPQAVAQLSG